MGLFDFSETIQIETDEYIVDLFRGSMFVFFKKSFFWFCFLFALFFFLFPLLRIGIVGLYLFFAGLSIVFFVIFRVLICWLGTCYIITNKRIIAVERTGYFKRTVYEILLTSVSELSYQTKGLFQTLFSFGTLTLTLTTSRGNFILKNIASPDTILERISKLVGEHKRKDI